MQVNSGSSITARCGGEPSQSRNAQPGAGSRPTWIWRISPSRLYLELARMRLACPKYWRSLIVSPDPVAEGTTPRRTSSVRRAGVLRRGVDLFVELRVGPAQR